MRVYRTAAIYLLETEAVVLEGCFQAEKTIITSVLAQQIGWNLTSYAASDNNDLIKFACAADLCGRLSNHNGSFIVSVGFAPGDVIRF